MGHLSARLSAYCQRQTAYLLLAEMSRAPINPWNRNKRDDRQEGHARGAGTSGCCTVKATPDRRNPLTNSRTVRTISYFFGNACRFGLLYSIGRVNWSSSSSRRPPRNPFQGRRLPMGVMRHSEVAYEKTLGLIAKRLRED